MFAFKTVLVIALISVLPNNNHKVYEHHGCRTKVCYDRLWHKDHPKPPFQFGSRELCVANRENGEPGATTFSTINWRADNEYQGAYSEEPEKWSSGRQGISTKANAYEASPQEQTEVFRRQVAVDPEAWLNTAPPCGY